MFDGLRRKQTTKLYFGIILRFHKLWWCLLACHIFQIVFRNFIPNVALVNSLHQKLFFFREPGMYLIKTVNLQITGKQADQICQKRTQLAINHGFIRIHYFFSGNAIIVIFHFLYQVLILFLTF